jgi:MFS family permease
VKRVYYLLLLLHYLATGIMIPVLSLVLIEKGCSLSNLALIVGLFALTVLLLELPSGILADIVGRKRIFILACLFNLLATGLLYWVSSIGWLIPVVILLGAGRACASGSLDAHIIDDSAAQLGRDKMATVTSRLALCEIAGLSAGSIIGGFLPVLSVQLLSGAYDFNILVRLVFYAGLTVLSALLISEKPARHSASPSLRLHLSQGWRFLRSSRIVLLLALGLACGGFFLFALETYWQIVFVAILPDPRLNWTIGLIPFGFLLCASLGNIAVERILAKQHRRAFFVYAIARILVFAALFVFARQRTAIGFAVTLLVVYFLYGGANVAESAIFNGQIPDDQRAGMLSFGSFAFQAGGLIVPVFSGFASSPAKIQTLWALIALLLLGVSVIIGRVLKVQAGRSSPPSACQITRNER